MRFLFCFFAAFLLCATIVCGQNGKKTIFGRLTSSEDGEPVIGATIIIENAKAGAYSDEKGRFTVSFEAIDTVKLLIESIGFDSVRQSFVMSEPSFELNLALSPQSHTLETQVIKADRLGEKLELSTVSVMALNQNQINNQASIDLKSTLEMQSGVTILNDQVSLRGSSGFNYGGGTRVLTLWNGMPLISSNTGAINFQLLPTDNVERVEVYKASSAVLYGSGAMGGVINVIMREPTAKPYIFVRATAKLIGPPANDSVAWDDRALVASPSIHFVYAKRFKERFDLTVQTDIIKGTGYKLGEFSTRGRLMLFTAVHRLFGVKGLTFSFNSQISLDSAAVFSIWENYPKGALTPRKNTLSRQWLQNGIFDAKLAYVSPKGWRLMYQGRVFQSSNQLTLGQSLTSILSYNEIQHERPIGKRFNLTTGLAYTHSLILADASLGKANGDAAGVYAQAMVKLIKLKYDSTDYRLRITLGARYQFETVAGDTNTNDSNQNIFRIISVNRPFFSLGANLRLHRATFIRASIGQGYRSPSVVERYSNNNLSGIHTVATPYIKVEQGYSAEVGLRQLWATNDKKWGGYIDVAAFRMEFDNMIEFSLDQKRSSFQQIVFATQNITNATIQGVEAETYFGGSFGKFKLAVSGGVTFIDAVNPNGLKELDGDATTPLIAKPPVPKTDPNYQKYVDDVPYTLKYRNRWLTRTSATLSYRNFSLTTNYRYSDAVENVDKLILFAVPGVNAFRKENPSGWHLIDIILGYQFRKNIFSFHVFNILNTEYALIPGYLGEQRSYVFQYRVTFK